MDMAKLRTIALLMLTAFLVVSCSSAGKNDGPDPTTSRYDSKSAAELCMIPEESIVRVARMAETIKPMHIMQGGSAQQWYHGDMKGRAFSLVAALTGNIGTQGGGISCYIGQYKVRFKPGAWFAPKTNKATMTAFHYFCEGPTETMKGAEFASWQPKQINHTNRVLA